MDKEYDFLIYQRGSETKEAKSIELKLPNDMNCSEFKVICIRMAHAIGYHENSVRETFGNIADINKSKDTNQIKLLFD
jgi:hypothetical protein|tara:strand:+ start:237 stop:470 length:234 start_codon:yes stop_codon:yes gene_type:complete